MIELRPIGHVRSDVHDLDAAPSQATVGPPRDGRVEVDARYADGLLGLDRYRWIWLLTWLHEQPAGPPPLQLVPRAREARGEVQGVFASRAPVRPNPIGLTLVELVGVHGAEVAFRGVDLLDGTPVLDIKPWYADCDRPGTLIASVRRSLPWLR